MSCEYISEMVVGGRNRGSKSIPLLLLWLLCLWLRGTMEVQKRRLRVKSNINLWVRTVDVNKDGPLAMAQMRGMT